MSANTSSVPCFSLYNLDLQRNVWYSATLYHPKWRHRQNVSTYDTVGSCNRTESVYPKYHTGNRTETASKFGHRWQTIYHSKHLVYILFQHTKMHTMTRGEKFTVSHTFLVSGQTRASLSVSQGHASSSRGHFFLPEGTLSLPACRGTVNQPSLGYDEWVE